MGVPVLALPAVVDALAGAGQAGVDREQRRGLQLLDQAPAAGRDVQPRRAHLVAQVSCPLWRDALRIDAQEFGDPRVSGATVVVRRGEADPVVGKLGVDRGRLAELLLKAALVPHRRVGKAGVGSRGPALPVLELPPGGAPGLDRVRVRRDEPRLVELV